MFFVAVFLALYTLDWSKENEKKAVLFFTFFLIIVGGLRGGFTTDYSHYAQSYGIVCNNDIFTAFNYRGEKGFRLLEFLTSRFFESPVPFFVICMAIILIPISNFSCKAKSPFLFMLLYLSFGIMFQSYNVMRFVMMASLYLISIEWVKKENFLKYVIFVLVLATIHTTALFLIPFYFLLKLDINVKTFFLHFLLIGFILFFLTPMMDYFDALFYSSKFATRDIGQMGGERSFKDIFVPLVFFVGFIFTEIFLKKRNVREINVENNILVNGSIYWFVSFLMAQKFAILGRFSYVFFPFVAMGFVNNIVSCPKNQKLVFVWLTFCFCALYYFVFGQYYKEFYFYWQTSHF